MSETLTVRPRRSRIRSRFTFFKLGNYSILTLATLLIAYPLYFVIIASFSDPARVMAGQVFLWVSGFDLEGYRRVLSDQWIWTGFLNSFTYLAGGTAINLTFTISAAYALSRKDLVGRTFFMSYFVFTMFFSGGMVPLYLLVRGLGLMNTRLVMMLIGAVNVYYLIVCRTYFISTIPDELLDAAKIDGCSDLAFFGRIVLPISTTIIAVMFLFYSVFHWNSFFSAILFIRSRNLFPLQLVLREILVRNQMLSDAIQGLAPDEVGFVSEQIKYAIILVASVPMFVLYPLVQKHFVKGVMIGSLKG